jgi:transposase
MSAYSTDLRERVIAAARDPNLTQPEIAATFSVSLSSVEAWLRTFRSSGRIHPLPFAGGAKRALQPHAQVIRELVAQQPDATLAELCARVAAQTGVRANPSMMCRELQILKLPRKKVTARQSTRNPARANTAGRPSRQNGGDPALHRRTPKIHR